MLSLVSTPRYLLIAALALISLALAAVDRPRISVVSVRTADDIILRMPEAGMYNLKIRFAQDVDPETRTAILNEALASERARDIGGLDLANNQLTQPPVLTGLVNLRKLYLSNNRLTQPPVLTDLVNLRELLLSDNELTQPPVLTGSVNLRKLDLADNQLTQSPVLADLVNLRELKLADNQLTQPPVLTDLVNLRELDLSGNQFTDQPVLTGLVNLWALNLADNHLIQPPVVTDLANLRVLNLSGNRLEQPPVLTGLVNLTNLALYDNQLLQAVVIPQQLTNRLDVSTIGAPYVIEGQVAATPTNLIDIAIPGVDTARPFFLTQESITALPRPRRNPLTQQQIVYTMNLVESWRYWRDRGLSAADFDSHITEPEPVSFEENSYTVTREVAQEFLRERGLTDADSTAIVSRFERDAINVSELLAAMSQPQEGVAEPACKRSRLNM